MIDLKGEKATAPPARRLLSLHSWIGLEALAVAGILQACAHDSGTEAPAELTVDDAAPYNEANPRDAFSDVDARPEASACSDSKICTVPIPIDETVTLTSVWGSSAQDVYAVGSDSTIVHYDGATWEKALRLAPDGSTHFTLQSVWLEHPDDVWIVEGNRIRHGLGWKGPTATEWSFFSQAQYVGLALTAIRGSGNSIWVALGNPSGGVGLEEFDGWGLDAPSGGQPLVRAATLALTTSRPNEVWGVGFGTDVIAASVVPYVGRLTVPIADGGSPDASRPSSQFEEYDSLSQRRLSGVWGDENAVWLIGEGGTIRRLTTSAEPTKKFEIMRSPAVEDLHGIFGFAADDIWAVGDASTVLHWDGRAWTKLSTPFDDVSSKPRLFAVWGSSPADLWIVGEGAMLHFPGSAQ